MGLITHIQPFSTNDGPGIRTVLFLKGCPLSCIWCHNPESKSSKPEISFDATRCLECFQCKDVCNWNCHIFRNGKHFFKRAQCNVCGKCTEICPSALTLVGKELSALEAAKLLMSDRAFFGDEGGITISGGEVLFQTDFSSEILRICMAEGISTCVESCLFGSFTSLENLVPYTDIFCCDWKLTNDALHRKYTGVSNCLIRQNLLKLDKKGKRIWLRCPIIPTVNDNKEHFYGIAKLANELLSIEKIHILPYHHTYLSKAKSFGIKPISFPVPEKKDIDDWIARIQKITSVPVERG